MIYTVILNMSYNDTLTNIINGSIDDIKSNQNEITKEMLESKLSHTKFKISFDNSLIYILLSLIGICALPLLKLILQPIITSAVLNKELSFDLFRIILTALFGAIILFITFLILYLLIKKFPSIDGTGLNYKNQCYHYSEISKIRLTGLKSAVIYADSKKICTVLFGTNNYQSFLNWAEICRIPIVNKHNK